MPIIFKSFNFNFQSYYENTPGSSSGNTQINNQSNVKIVNW